MLQRQIVINAVAVAGPYKPNAGPTKTIPMLTSSSAVAERPRELGDFKKARVNGGTDNDSLKDSYKSLRCR